MTEASEVLREASDFSSFCLSGSDVEHHRCTIREISLESHDDFGGMIVFEVTADRFLRGMVRSIVGTLIQVGRGHMRPSAMRTVLVEHAQDKGFGCCPPVFLLLRPHG